MDLTIEVKVLKSEKDEFGAFFVTITGSCEGEPYQWPLDGTFTDESWAEVEQQRIAEFKRQVETQF
jgi:hypothetical protein